MKGTRDERMAELSVRMPVWQPRTIWNLFCETAARCPDRDFLVFDDGRCCTYGDTLRESRAMMRELKQLGVQTGDVVALKSTNRLESVMLSLALSGMRVVKASLNPGLRSYELAFILRQCGARVLFTDSPVDFTQQEAVPSLQCLVSAANEPIKHADWSRGLSVVRWSDLIAGDAERLPQGSVRMEHQAPAYVRDALPQDKCAFEVSDIMFTSGSTGNPKGAKLSHDMLLRSAWANCLNRGFEEGRRIFVPLPLFHVYGYVEGLLAALFVGGTLLMSAKKVTPEYALSFMRDAGANDVLAVPSLMMKYLDFLAGNPSDFPQLHAVYCSASSCPDGIWPAIRNRLGVDDVITGYGMTEVAGASLQTVPGDSDWTLANRVGKQMPCGNAGLARYHGGQMEYRIVDDKGALCDEGVDGELQCRGATVCYGYCNEDDATSRSFTEDGWFRTGDVGQFDADGYLALSGRIKDSYKINGENVSTRFVEKILQKFPGVAEVEVVGIPDARLGAVGAVFVQLEQDSMERRSEFEEFCSRNLARYQVPKYHYYLTAGEWPLTPVGKVRKEDLRTMAMANSGREVT